MGVDGIELKNSFQQAPRTIPLMGVAYESVISQTKRVTPSHRYQNNKFINRNLNLISILLHHLKKTAIQFNTQLLVNWINTYLCQTNTRAGHPKFPWRILVVLGNELSTPKHSVIFLSFSSPCHHFVNSLDDTKT